MSTLSDTLTATLAAISLSRHKSRQLRLYIMALGVGETVLSHIPRRLSNYLIRDIPRRESGRGYESYTDPSNDEVDSVAGKSIHSYPIFRRAPVMLDSCLLSSLPSTSTFFVRTILDCGLGVKGFGTFVLGHILVSRSHDIPFMGVPSLFIRASGRLLFHLFASLGVCLLPLIYGRGVVCN